MLKEINSKDFEKEVLKNEKPVLVDFYASWCMPCKMISPVLERVANSRADFNIIKVNIDDNLELANEYKIEVVPTMVIFKDGKEVDKIVGLVNEEQIMDKMANYID